MSASRIIVIRERFAESASKDVVSIGLLLAVVGIGIWLNSQALQWVGAVLWIISVLARVLGRTNLTIPEAQAQLAKWAAEDAGK